MKKNLIFFLALLLFVSGCSSTKYICPDGREVLSQSDCSYCGNNICDNYEDYCSCPTDCKEGQVPKCPADKPFTDQHTLCCVGGCTPGVSC